MDCLSGRRRNHQSGEKNTPFDRFEKAEPPLPLVRRAASASGSKKLPQQPVHQLCRVLLRPAAPLPASRVSTGLRSLDLALITRCSVAAAL